MADRHDITLREVDIKVDDKVAAAGAANWFEEIKRALGELFPVGETAAKNYVKGKGQAEVAKAAEIQSRVMTALGNLALENQRLVDERDTAVRADQTDRTKAAMEHRQEMYRLKTERLKEIVTGAAKLKELGVRIDLRPLAELLITTAKEDGPIVPLRGSQK